MFNCCEFEGYEKCDRCEKPCCEKKYREEKCCEKKYREEKYREEKPYEKKRHCQHVHEYEGSVMVNCKGEPHTHRFAGVTGEAIPTCDSHVHKLHEMTDTYECHQHILCETTGPAVWVSCDRHVHFVEGCTSFDACHKHDFKFSTLIENPIGE